MFLKSIFVSRPNEGKEAQWGIIEMQGDLISQSGDDLHGQFIGDLHYTKQVRQLSLKSSPNLSLQGAK